MLASSLVPTTAFGSTYNVVSITGFQARLHTAKPGDTIILRNGTYYVDQPIIIACAGKEDNPIRILAESVGGVELTGDQGVSFYPSAAHIVFDGFNITHQTGIMNIRSGAHHIRVFRCNFKCPGRGPYFTVSGDDIEIAYNLFREKSRWGNMISITGANGQVARRVWIHHNHFRDFNRSTEPGETNDLEVIRYGLSGLSMSMGHGTIEHNLFERCVGENELISNKSGGNIYRYNTFLDSPGSELSLRHGNECVAYRNYFHNTQGIRIFGDRHKIFENFIEEGSIGIHIGNGGAEVADGAPLTSHDRPDDNVITRNILVNNDRQYFMAPRNNGLGAPRTTFSENILIGGNVAAKIGGPYPDAVWKDNIVWNVRELGDMPKDTFRSIDPGVITPESLGISILTPKDVGLAAKKRKN
jgi:poly(beta-D-mannuronate) lyase